MTLDFAVAELTRMVTGLLRVGTVTEADYAAVPPRVRVQSGDLHIGWIPWLERRAGDDRTWCAPTPGEQVVVLCPQGDPSLGVVLGSIPCTAHPPAADAATVHRTVYADGAVIAYDRAAHRLYADLPGDAVIEAEGAVSVTAGDAITATSEAGITLSAPIITLDAPTVRCTRDLDVVGEITDHVDTEPHTLSGMRAIYDDHTHTELGIGGQTSIPDELMGGGA